MPCFQLGPWRINQNANLPSTSSCTVTLKMYLRFFPIFYSTIHCPPPTPQLLSPEYPRLSDQHITYTWGSCPLPLPCPNWNKSSEAAQLCPTLCNLMDCSIPGSSVHETFQATVLEWVAISFSRGSSQPRDRTRVSHTAGRRFTIWTTRETLTETQLRMPLLMQPFPVSQRRMVCSYSHVGSPEPLMKLLLFPSLIKSPFLWGMCHLASYAIISLLPVVYQPLTLRLSKGFKPGL